MNWTAVGERRILPAVPGTPDPAAVAAGFAFGLSLIVAIGAQNAFVLRQGLRGEHTWLVVATCALSDLVLIAAGIAGAAVVLDGAPGLVDAVRIAGALFLLGYAALAARRAARPTALRPDAGSGAGRAATLGTALALTWLNPHVYLDTIVLLGSVADAHDGDRWSFGLGAGVASVVWFCGLGFGAALLRPLFARPGTWRVLDGGIAVVMVAVAAGLVAGAV